jgi:hypothetical protein
MKSSCKKKIFFSLKLVQYWFLSESQPTPATAEAEQKRKGASAFVLTMFHRTT